MSLPESPPVRTDPSRRERPAGAARADPLAAGQRGHRRLVLAAAVSLPIFAVFALVNAFVHEAPRMAATSALAALLAAGSLWTILRAGDPRLGGHLFVLAFAAQVLGEMAVNGGVQAPATPLAVLVGPAAILLIGFEAGRIWTLVVLGALLGVVTLDLFGLLPPNELPPQAQAVDRALSLLAGVAVSLLVVGGFERQVRDSLARVDDERNRWLHEATHDGLTGLPNRSLFRRAAAERIGQAAAGARPCTLFYLDIDRFKQVNDGLGHAVGDQLLVAFADRLHRRLRPGDLAARLSGDEFVVLAADCDERAASALLHDRLLAITADPFELGGLRLRVGVSIGHATTGPQGFDLDELMREADHAMYRCKDANRAQGREPAG